MAQRARHRGLGVTGVPAVRLARGSFSLHPPSSKQHFTRTNFSRFRRPRGPSSDSRNPIPSVGGAVWGSRWEITVFTGAVTGHRPWRQLSPEPL